MVTLHLLFQESVYKSKLFIEPRQLLYQENLKLLFVVCYSSKNIFLFECNPNLTLLRTIETIENPCNVRFSNNYLYIASNGGNNGLNYIQLYPSDSDYSEQQQTISEFNNENLIIDTYPQTFNMEIEYNNIFIDEDLELLISLSKNNKTLDFFDITVFNDTTTNSEYNDFTNIHENILNSNKHQIKNINRDINGQVIIELHTHFDNIKNYMLNTKQKNNIINVSNQLVFSLDILEGYSNS